MKLRPATAPDARDLGNLAFEISANQFRSSSTSDCALSVLSAAARRRTLWFGDRPYTLSYDEMAACGREVAGILPTLGQTPSPLAQHLNRAILGPKRCFYQDRAPHDPTVIRIIIKRP